MSGLNDKHTLSNFHEIHHPLIASKLSLLRTKETDHKLFRELVHEITLLLGYEATKLLPTEQATIHTPMEPYQGTFLVSPATIRL